MVKEKKWFAIYTKPRWEKKVHGLLIDCGIESYCPLNKVRRKWSDRIKLVEEPLFTSYVFVCIEEEEQTTVRMVNGVVNYVYWLGKPAIITAKDIDRIKRFLNDYEDVSAEAITTTIKRDDVVVVNTGALMDKQGKVMRQVGNKVELEIESLGYKLIAYVERKNISKID